MRPCKGILGSKYFRAGLFSSCVCRRNSTRNNRLEAGYVFAASMLHLRQHPPTTYGSACLTPLTDLCSMAADQSRGTRALTSRKGPLTTWSRTTIAPGRRTPTPHVSVAAKRQTVQGACRLLSHTLYMSIITGDPS